MENEQLILKLSEIQAIKFGTFTLKSGLISPIYLDLRVTVSYPKILEAIADAIWNRVSHLSFDLVCGVPYTALPIATAISLKRDKPMVLRRKEAKGYGTKRIIEGAFQAGHTCLVVEDLVTSALSIFETIEALEDEDLSVAHAAVLIDREQGGKDHLTQEGITLHSVMTLSEIAETLCRQGQMDVGMAHCIRTFIKHNQAPHPLDVPS